MRERPLGETGREENHGLRVLTIEYPDELLEVLGETEAGFHDLAQELLLIKLYELGKISSSLAAQILGISRRQFLDLLSRYQVSLFDEESGLSLNEEAQRG